MARITTAQISAYLEARKPHGIAVIADQLLSRSNVVSTELVPLTPPADSGPVTFDVLWFDTRTHADAVLAELRDTLKSLPLTSRDNWLLMPPLDLRDHLVRAASDVGADWHTTEDLRSRASDAVSEILAKIEAMRVSGGLSDLNSSYKNYRQSQLATGAKAKPYSAFLADFTMNMITLTAQHATT